MLRYSPQACLCRAWGGLFLLYPSLWIFLCMALSWVWPSNQPHYLKTIGWSAVGGKYKIKYQMHTILSIMIWNILHDIILLSAKLESTWNTLLVSKYSKWNPDTPWRWSNKQTNIISNSSSYVGNHPKTTGTLCGIPKTGAFPGYRHPLHCLIF